MSQLCKQVSKFKHVGNYIFMCACIIKNTKYTPIKIQCQIALKNNYLLTKRVNFKHKDTVYEK